MNRAVGVLRLVRLPNVFTALADVSVGILAGQTPAGPAVALLVASAGLYSAGMAWNDFFDRDVDRLERPGRPIPSGAVTAARANQIAVVLAALAICSAAAAGLAGAAWSPSPLIHAAGLLALILGYDALAKGTPIGPFVMGGCRFVNVLFGFSLTSADVVPWPVRMTAAAIVGMYVVGVTLFARDEATTSRGGRLIAAAAVCLAAVAATLVVPAIGSVASAGPLPYLVAALVAVLAVRASDAIAHPHSPQVQRFVKTAILAIIVLDACLAMGTAGPVGVAVILWLLPAVTLGRWLYST